MVAAINDANAILQDPHPEIPLRFIDAIRLAIGQAKTAESTINLVIDSKQTEDSLAALRKLISDAKQQLQNNMEKYEQGVNFYQ